MLHLLHKKSLDFVAAKGAIRRIVSRLRFTTRRHRYSTIHTNAAMDAPYAHELHIAELAVHQASLLTKRVLQAVDKGSLSKSDKTPVTVADFGSQALLISALHHAFPNDGFIGEEDSSALRSNSELRERVWDLVKSTTLEGDDATTLHHPGSADEMMEMIDLGVNAAPDSRRTWVMDPIDGTEAFLRGEQYAVALALLVDGVQKVAVLGCPNLVLDDGRFSETVTDRAGYGYRLFAVQGRGAFMRKISDRSDPVKAVNLADPEADASVKRLRLNQNLPVRPRFVDWEDKSMDVVRCRAVAKELDGTWVHTSAYAAQLKYVVIATGCADILTRYFKSRDRKSFIYDHAGGILVAEEAGAVVTDLDGKKIDFTTGRRLSANYGFAVAVPLLHAKAIRALKIQFQG
ncbi:carbohydrate phosphatase [Eremomyces bilateralis CBS 781.70]|uniref:Carbohydrate phosphatase n=1 Tax=Eremomyces bilateralis CBS 781.70 TaxID=1392243 RepID=A0A6G1GAA2_9PEZI|nr:carbohydrate phosphatase [Eremomyces bilateralis CBS 781.70]KAF1815005.1 carbohydrate phosphatase [Eremomyces bilateralis CBS 781.70]